MVGRSLFVSIWIPNYEPKWRAQSHTNYRAIAPAKLAPTLLLTLVCMTFIGYLLWPPAGYGIPVWGCCCRVVVYTRDMTTKHTYTIIHVPLKGTPRTMKVQAYSPGGALKLDPNRGRRMTPDEIRDMKERKR